MAEESVIAGLRSAIPAGIEIHVVFDTDPPIGASTVRSVGGLSIHHARAGGGDDTIARLTATQPASTLVVSDDIELGQRVRALGARTERNEWLLERRGLRRAPTASIGSRLARTDADHDADDERDVRGWRPGRGATTKRGNPRRPPKRR